MKKGLFTLVVGAGLAFGGMQGWKYFTSPERARERELNHVARYLLKDIKDNPSGEAKPSLIYIISGNRKVETCERDNSKKEGGCFAWENKSLSLIVDDKVLMCSEGFEGYTTSDDDARNLKNVYFKQGENWVEQDNLNLREWQRKYEEILLDVAKTKREKTNQLQNDYSKIIFGEQ